MSDDEVLEEFDDLLDEDDILAEFDDLAALSEPEPEFEYTPVDLNQAVTEEPKPKRGSGVRKVGEPRKPMYSGHCLHPQTAHPEESHERCTNQGAGNRAVPDKVFSPCPCWCHLGEVFECGGCGGVLREAPHFPNADEPGEMVYVHVRDEVHGEAGSEFCT